jgi:hypothetical protein
MRGRVLGGRGEEGLVHLCDLSVLILVGKLRSWYFNYNSNSERRFATKITDESDNTDGDPLHLRFGYR